MIWMGGCYDSEEDTSHDLEDLEYIDELEEMDDLEYCDDFLED